MTVAGRTVMDVIRLSTSYLAQHGSASPRLDAELLIARVLHGRRIDLYLQHDRPLNPAELQDARTLMRRRAGGEPVAYITGVREFYGRPFAVTPAVLIPRPETETLVEHALAEVRRRDAAAQSVCVADLGTGSGCVAVTLAAEVAGLQVVATDISEAALEVARGNAEQLGVSDRVRLVRSDWAAALDAPIDVVVSNPPYVRSDELAAADTDVRDHEPRVALDGGVDGLDAYRALDASLRERLAPGATLLLEVDPRRAGDVAAIFGAPCPGTGIAVHRDLAGHERVLEAQRE